MTSKTLIVLGGGPGGYAAALEAASRGFQVTLVDPAPLGGTCLHRGCIPSKFLLAQAKQAREPVAAIGALMAQKDAVLATLSQRMEQGAKAAKIERLCGYGRLISAHEVGLTSKAAGHDDDLGRRTADFILLATGSAPIYPETFPRHSAVFTSDTIFSIDYLPAHLVVLGGGYIGSELACAFQGLGSKVTLIEKEPALLATQPEFAAAAPVLQRSLAKRGLTVWTGTEVKSVVAQGERKLLVTCSNGETLEANAFLLALGRRPQTEIVNAQAAGLQLEQGRIRVNSSFQTSMPSVYAIGDLVSALPLAHTATKEAETAVAHMQGAAAHPVNYSAIPRVVYTTPEIAAVGFSEAQAQAAGHKTKLDRYHFAASSKAMIEGDAEGFWLVMSDADSRKILGAMIVGPHATELIHLVALAIRGGLTTTDIADTVFAHPTLSEGFMEAMKRSSARAASDVRSPRA